MKLKKYKNIKIILLYLFSPIYRIKKIKYCILKLIKFYQYIILPIIGYVCCFHPSCSNYCIEAIKKHGILKGSYFSNIRLLRCNPYTKISDWNELP